VSSSDFPSLAAVIRRYLDQTPRSFDASAFTNYCFFDKKGKKVKEVDLYSAIIEVPHTQGAQAQVQITQCYLQITPYLPLPRKHSPDGASPD